MKLSDFLSDLGRPVAYYPGLALALDDAKEAIFICQMSYWKGKEQDPDGWIYKESQDITRETGLSYKEQRNVRAGLVAKNLMEEEYRRTEHRMYFRIDWDAVNSLWDEHLTNGHMPKGKVLPAQREDGTLPKVNSGTAQREDGTLPKVNSLNRISENTAKTTSENTRDGAFISHKNAWEQAVEILSPQIVSRESYLSESRAIRYDGNTLFIEVPTSDARDWLHARVKRSAENLLVGFYAHSVSVEFVTGSGDVSTN